MKTQLPVRGRMAHLVGITLMVTVLCLLPPTGAAKSADPKVPPGNDPGGEPIALITRGIDYTLPKIAARLARDGEGELIGWDVVDDDSFPFAANGGGDTPLAGDLVGLPQGERSVTLLVVRADPASPVSLAKALAFVTRTPARRVLVPFWSTQREDWEPFLQAAQHFKDLKIVVPACAASPAGAGAAIYPRDLGEPNIVASMPEPGDPAAAWIGHILDLPCEASPAR